MVFEFYFKHGKVVLNELELAKFVADHNCNFGSLINMNIEYTEEEKAKLYENLNSESVLLDKESKQ